MLRFLLSGAVLVLSCGPLLAQSGPVSPSSASGGRVPSAEDERVSASFLLARGRRPAPAETAAWGSRGPGSVADLLARHQRELQADAAAARDVAAKAWRDAVGAAPSEDEMQKAAGGETYFTLVQRFVASLAQRPAEYEQVLQRAYQLRLRRAAHAVEIEYWKRQPVLPFALVVACVDDWARRNRPGLMATAGPASVSVNSDYLETVRLSPAIAAEARAAVGWASWAAADHLGDAALPLAAGRNVTAPNAAHVVSVGGVHFAAAGRETR